MQVLYFPHFRFNHKEMDEEEVEKGLNQNVAVKANGKRSEIEPPDDKPSDDISADVKKSGKKKLKGRDEKKKLKREREASISENSNSDQKTKRKRENKEESSTENGTGVDAPARTSPKQKRGNPLNGLIVAISTLEVKGQAHSEADVSYKSVAQSCRDAGAQVSGQVHKRVTCLVCTRTAVQHATQRVRKAYKKNLPLVDVGWVAQCQMENRRVEFGPYRLDEEAKKVIDKLNQVIETAAKQGEKGAKASLLEQEIVPESGWSEPVELGCCCVCHENGAADSCEWCVDCKV
jgi:hypothetical protein